MRQIHYNANRKYCRHGRIWQIHPHQGVSILGKQNGKRIVIVLDTVAEVFNLWMYLNKLSVNCSPLVGRSERLKYINQIAEPNKTCLPSSLSQYLTNACLVDGMNDGDEASLAYGKEPCFSLKEPGKSKAFLCPYFNICHGAKMLRDCYTASVVLTSVAGFAISRVGKNREPFLDVALRKFDIVIFDESDRVQKHWTSCLCRKQVLITILKKAQMIALAI